MKDNKKRNLVDPFAYMRMAAALTIFIFHAKIFSGMHGYEITGANWFMKAAGHGAVWAFFFLSGYFNIKGFLGDNPQNRLDPQGILRFYIRRFFKVLLPVWCFYIIALTISEPAFLQIYPETIWRLLTFTYSGEPGCTSIAATWYVSSLAWLYLFTPAIAWVCRKLDRSERCIHIAVIALAIALAGLVLRIYLLFAGVDWTQGVFVPFYCNLDLYICGALAFMTGKRIRLRMAGGVSYALSFIIYTLLLTFHNRIYYLGDLNGIYIAVHEYLMPTVYILIMTIICVFIQNTGYRYLPVSLNAVRKNPFRLIDAFSLISFQFYLIHSMVLFHLSSVITEAVGADYNRKLLISGFCIAVPLSVLLKKATDFKVPASESRGRDTHREASEDRASGEVNESAT